MYISSTWTFLICWPTVEAAIRSKVWLDMRLPTTALFRFPECIANARNGRICAWCFVPHLLGILALVTRNLRHWHLLSAATELSLLGSDQRQWFQWPQTHSAFPPGLDMVPASQAIIPERNISLSHFTLGDTKALEGVPLNSTNRRWMVNHQNHSITTS